jgi:hypothetical protein
MPKSKIIYQADQEIIGRHLKAKEWIMYTGKLTIYERNTYPVVLKLKSELYDSILGEFMDELKEFKGTTVSDVFGKLSRWYYKNGIIFQN